MKYQCYCCGNYSLEENPEDPTFEICPICRWENDPIQNSDIDYYGGANRISLRDARENYKKMGAKREDCVGRARKPLDSEK